MASISQNKKSQAGVIYPARLNPELNDGTRGQSYESVPTSPFTISETQEIPFCNGIMNMKHGIFIADGSVRPGTAR